MALTLSQLVAAVGKYADKLSGDPAAEAALTRNLELLRGRIASTETALRTLVVDVGVEGLSSDPSVAIHQILTAVGHPVTLTPEGASIGIDPGAVLADASPEQIRELALLGFFGQSAPNPVPGVDYSLFDQYYEHDQPNHWQPKEPYLITGTWQAYLAAKAG